MSTITEFCFSLADSAAVVSDLDMIMIHKVLSKIESEKPGFLARMEKRAEEGGCTACLVSREDAGAIFAKAYEDSGLGKHDPEIFRCGSRGPHPFRVIGHILHNSADRRLAELFKKTLRKGERNSKSRQDAFEWLLKGSRF